MNLRVQFCGRRRTVTLAGCLAGLATGGALAAPVVSAQVRGHDADARNMRLLGTNDLQARSAYQPTIHRNAETGRWIAYVGHHGGNALNPQTNVVEGNGTSLLDVTNPRRPRYLKHIPGPAGAGEAGGAQMVRVCNGQDLPRGDRSKVYMLRANGNESHQLWDVTDPAAPTLLNTVVGGLAGTHKNFWECETGIAYLVSGIPGWRTNRMTQVFDLSDPAAPRHIRDFGLVGQEPGAVGPVPTGLHGPISLGNRVFFGYGTSTGGVLQIVDREELLSGAPAPTPANLLSPQVSRLNFSSYVGAHTTLPVLGVPIPEHGDFTAGATRDLVVVVNESLRNECIGEAHQMMWIVDITDEANPQVISNYQVPESEGEFCQRGGRFGAHSSNEHQPPQYYRKVVFLAYFNAGVRAVDIRDPFRPREIARYVPATTANTDALHHDRRG